MPRLADRKEYKQSSTRSLDYTRWGWVVNATPRPLCPCETSPVPSVEEAAWASGTGWTRMEREILLPSPGFESWTVQPHFEWEMG
jgi:hypothetical protein